MKQEKSVTFMTRFLANLGFVFRSTIKIVSLCLCRSYYLRSGEKPIFKIGIVSAFHSSCSLEMGSIVSYSNCLKIIADCGIMVPSSNRRMKK